MPIHFCCDQCARPLSVEPGEASPTISCPGCGRAVSVPAATPKAWWLGAATSEAPPVQPAASAGADWWLASGPPPVPVVPAPVPTTPAGRRLPVLALIGGAVGLGVLVCVLAIAALPKRDRTTAPSGEGQQALLPDRNEPRQLVRQAPLEPIPDTPVPSPVRPNQPEENASPPLDPAPGVRAVPARREPPTITPPAVEKPAPAQPAGKRVVKRRVEIGEDELLRQLAKAPALTLDRSNLRAESQRMLAAGTVAARLGKDAGTTVALMEKRPDLVGMPWLKGDACKISPTAASHLEGGSVALRGFMTGASTQAALRRIAAAPGLPDPDNLASQMNKDAGKYNQWVKSEAIPALQQLLMAEHEAIREVLVDQLARIEGKRASVALAQRALYDLHPRVREKALNELAKRPAAEYREVLVKGFEHPWPPVAEHAAEALATLEMKETVPTLLTLLDMPDPAAPRKGPKKGMVIKEMVRVNHLLNCLMCHAPSVKNEDKVRGRVPPLNQPLPPAFTRAYYSDRTGVFVRADVTYLRQDFSVPLPVKNHGVWPEVQRFDFLVRERPATLQDAMDGATKKRAAKGPSKQHRSLFFALRELTGADAGPTVEDWKQYFGKRKLKVRAVTTGFKAARGVVVDRGGRIYVADDGKLFRWQGEGRPTPWLDSADGFAGLAVDGRDNVLAAQGKTGQVLRIDVGSREVQTAAARFDGKRFNHPNRLVVDRHGGTYFTDDRSLDAQHEGGTYYLSAAGRVTRLPVALVRPCGIGLAADGKTLFVSSPASPTVMAYPIESAGSLGEGRVVCRMASKSGTAGPADLTVDGRGNLHLLNAGAQTVEVVAPEGARLGQAQLPDGPIACAAGKNVLWVLTRKALYSVELPDLDFTRVARR